MRYEVDQALRDRVQHLQASGRRRDWYRIENAAGEGDAPAEIWVYDEISWMGVTAKDFVSELRSVDAKNLTLHLNSPGGDVFDGIAIYQALKAHPAKVTARVEGLAASIASVIAMAADQVVMAEHSTMMIHDPWGITVGNAADHRHQADILDQLGNEIARIYADKAGTGYKAWRDTMQAETWYTDTGAVDAGLADAIDSGAAKASAANLLTFDLSVFRHPPADLVDALRDAGPAGKPTRRTAERALRDAGFSVSQAKALTREWGDEPTESEPDETPDLEALLAGLRALRAS